MSTLWQKEPPDTPGLWWLYGDEEFGTMGGNYTGFFPPDEKLQVVDVWKTGSGLMGVCRGRMISLTPFDNDKGEPGYVGVWQKVVLPELPKQP